jgi:DNA polymerase-3 subunit delta
MLVPMTGNAPFGRFVLIVGNESFLAERTVREITAACLRQQPAAAVSTVDAADLNVGQLMEMTGSALFSAESVAVVTGLESLPANVTDALLALARAVPPEVALVASHEGGAKGKPLLDKLRPLADELVECRPVKTWELARFVQTEARRLQVQIGADAAQQLVDSVGTDIRALAAAVDQLASDAGGEAVSVAAVKRLFAGRADVSSFAVADDVLAGRYDQALEKLRWALTTGVSPVLVTGTLASSMRQLGRFLDARGDRRPEAALAKELGVPPWKMKDLAAQSRAWDPTAVAAAIRAIAVADADVKGASGDAEFALEQLLGQLVTLRRSAR